jgi:phosphoribosyl 1,2-cyclic phosphate phosphodiesterase
MNKEGKFVFLGTGSSIGIPVIGCDCSICTSKDPKNHRRRSSAYFEVGGRRILIDAGPDFRAQALEHKLDRIDGCMITHAHYDHIGGFDDLKVYQHPKKERLPCFLSKETLKELMDRFSYLFHPTQEDPLYSPFFDIRPAKADFGQESLAGIPFSFVTYIQTQTKVLGFRFGNLAYVSDIKIYEEKVIADLQGVELLIVSAIKEAGSQMHFSVEEALSFRKKVGAKKTYLTHIAHEMDLEKMRGLLPQDVEIAHDGMVIYFKL